MGLIRTCRRDGECGRMHHREQQARMGARSNDILTRIAVPTRMYPPYPPLSTCHWWWRTHELRAGGGGRGGMPPHDPPHEAAAADARSVAASKSPFTRRGRGTVKTTGREKQAVSTGSSATRRTASDRLADTRKVKDELTAATSMGVRRRARCEDAQQRCTGTSRRWYHQRTAKRDGSWVRWSKERATCSDAGGGRCGCWCGEQESVSAE